MFRLLMITLTLWVALCESQMNVKLPVLKKFPSEEFFTASEESVLFLKCSTVGKDEGITYSWLKDGQPFVSTNSEHRQNEGTIIIKNPARSLQGQYQCLAQTPYGMARSQPVKVKQMYVDAPKVELQKHKPILGSEYRLECKIPDSYPEPEIIWLNQSVSDPSISREIFNRRIIVAPTGDLFFSEVTKGDTSSEYKYVCVALSPLVQDDFIVLAEHVLEDVVSGETSNGELIQQYVSGDITSKVGDVTMLYCIYGGTPLAYPDWFKDGKNINSDASNRVTRYNRSSGKRLLIKRTFLSDDGEYTCIVNNDVGKIQQHTMKLNVVRAPIFTEGGPVSATAATGDDVTIPCKAYGVPQPHISWSYNTREITRDIIQVTERGNVTFTLLKLRDLKPEHTGYYGCTASNEHGAIYTETLLYVH